MLLSLHIQGYQLIHASSLHFSSGMSVITGETGAGKSLLLDALGLALGDKLEKSRELQEPIDILATFDIQDLPTANQWLKEQGLKPNVPGTTCTLRRLISPPHRSLCFINNQKVGQQQLKALAQELIHRHSQHAHQELFKAQAQRRWLDDYGRYNTLQKPVADAYRHWQALLKQQEALNKAQQLGEQNRHLLTYQVTEWQALHLGEQEVARLEQEYHTLANAQTYQETLAQAAFWLQDEQRGAQAALAHSIKQLEGCLALPEVKAIVETLAQWESPLSDLARQISRLSTICEGDPARLQQLETRLLAIDAIAHKHKVKAKELYAHGQALEQRFHALLDSAQEQADLAEKLRNAQTAYLEAAHCLSKARYKAAQRLGTAITQAMQALNMPGGLCQIRLHSDPEQSSAEGIDTVCFEASTNPDRAPQPIAKIASGGELARIALCIQSLTAAAKATPTLLFDEIDVGVGGQTGALIGQALKKLSTQVQVICITHLPQVAAFAQHHFQVQKTHLHEHTQTHIIPLDRAAREAELARMLAGTHVGPEALANAQKMLEVAR